MNDEFDFGNENSDFHENMAEMGAATAGLYVAVGTLKAVGGGLSGAGIAHGLAILGGGSMLLGIGTVAGVYYGTYKGTKYVINKMK